MRNADFERCADFLARMIEKYGNELNLPKAENKDSIIVASQDNVPTAGGNPDSCLTNQKEAC